MQRDKQLWFSVAVLTLAHVFALGAGFFAPNDPAEQNRDFPFAPPMHLRFVDAAGKFHVRPFVYPYSWVRSVQGYEEDRSQMWPLRFFVREEPHQNSKLPGGHRRLFGVDAPGRIFLLGTDDYGRDQLSRFLYGGQISLFAGLLAAALSLGLGVLLGTIAG